LALSAHLFGRWLFSHEEGEGEGGTRVYRPRGTPLPPSRRPRDGFDIDEDGAFRAYTPGAADASTARGGRWTAAGARIEVAFDDGGPRSTLEIVDAAPGTLKVRRA
jgi:hypothetical protein